MRPVARIVAGPKCGVTLAPGERGTRKNERTLVRTQLEQSLIRRSRHEHSVDVVDLAVICRSTFVVMAHIQRHRPACRIENRWLIHVVPDSGDTAFSRSAYRPPHHSRAAGLL